MGGIPNISRWLAVPARPGGTHSGQPGQRLLVPTAVLTVAIAVTAAAALGTGHDAARQASAEQTAKDTKSDYLQPVGVLVRQGTLPEPTMRGDQGSVGVPPKTPARPTKPVDLAVGRTAAQYSGRSGTLTPAGIATLAMQRGCSSTQAVIATAVAMAESGGSPSAQGDVSLMDSTWDWSAGLWQIRGLRAQRGTGALRDAVANQNALTNSVAMYTISDGCTNWVPWSTYNTGAYRSYLGVATQAVNYVVGYYQAHHRYPAVAPPDPNATVPVPAGGGYGAAPAPAAAAGNGASAKTSAAAKPKAASSSHAAGMSGSSSAAAGGNPGGGNRGATKSGGGAARPSSTRTTPAPAKSTPKPVDKVTSAVGGVTSAVGSATAKLPVKLPCVPVPPLTKC